MDELKLIGFMQINSSLPKLEGALANLVPFFIERLPVVVYVIKLVDRAKLSAKDEVGIAFWNGGKRVFSGKRYAKRNKCTK